MRRRPGIASIRKEARGNPRAFFHQIKFFSRSSSTIGSNVHGGLCEYIFYLKMSPERI